MIPLLPSDLIASYLLLGAFAGILAGLLGIGGGLIIVPALILLFEAQNIHSDIIVHLALGTSLATIAITALSSIRSHHKRGAVLWHVVRQMSPGLFFGTLAGAWLAGLLHGDWLRAIVCIFMIYVALQMIFDFRVSAHQALPGTTGMNITGTVIGILSALVGIGGGTLIVPFLNWCRQTIRDAIGTSAACGLPIALAGALGYMLVGLGRQHLPDYSTGFVYWPAFFIIVLISILTAPLGARLSHQMPVGILKKVFAGILVIAAWRMSGL